MGVGRANVESGSADLTHLVRIGTLTAQSGVTTSEETVAPESSSPTNDRDHLWTVHRQRARLEGEILVAQRILSPCQINIRRGLCAMNHRCWRNLIVCGLLLVALWPQPGYSQAKKKGKAKAKAKMAAKDGAKSSANDSADAQAPTPGKDSPAGRPTDRPASSKPDSAPMPSAPSAPRADVDAKSLLAALSSAYRLNGQLVTVNRDSTMYSRAAQASDPAIREIGRRAAYTVYLNHLLQLKKPPEDLARIASDLPPDEGVAKLAEFVQNRRLTQEEEDRQRGVDLLSSILDPSKDLSRELFEKLLKEPQERESLLMPARLVSHREAMQLLEDVRRLANATTAAEHKDAIRPTLDRSSRQLVELRFKNESGRTLHNVLLATRLTPDPKLVGKRSDAQIATRLGFPAISGKSDLKYSAQAALAIRLEHQLAEMQRGTMVFIPDLPAGASVELPLATADDFALLRSTELSLWSDELRMASVELGSVARPQAQRLVPDRGGNVTMNVNITRDSPIDSYDYKLGNGKFCQVFELPLEKQVTYEVRSVIPHGMEGKEGYRPCHLRLENADGKVVALESQTLVTNAGSSLTFTPSVAGDYRLICTATIGESRCELWVRKQRGTSNSPSPAGKSSRPPIRPISPFPPRP